VDDVLTLDRTALRGRRFFSGVAELLALLRRLRAEKFSLVVDFQGYGETAFFARWTGAAERWGMVQRESRRWAFTKGFRRDDSLHIADWNRALLLKSGLRDAAPRNRLVLPRAAIDAARKLLAERGIVSGKPLLFVQAFTSSPQKDWPLPRYIEVAQHWRAAGRQVVFGGGPADVVRLNCPRRFIEPFGTRSCILEFEDCFTPAQHRT
jgi:ADP-heptose:LPS heptosyltransferase